MAYVYILASQKNGTLYIGVTMNLQKRVFEHKGHFVKGFTERYQIYQLVYYAVCDSIISAIVSEKKLKNLSRKRKLEIIEAFNPNWNDLYTEL